MAIDTAVADGIATITINRPEKKNSITLEMRGAIARAFHEAQDNPEVRVVVFTGAGSDFSAGADVGEMGTGGINGSIRRMHHMHRMLRGVANTNKPVIAAVRGVCVGMSFSMALASDFIIAAEDARFQFAFRHLGLAPDAGAAFLLTRYVGIPRAKELIYSGRFVSGKEAAQLGIALEALPADDVLPRAMEMARTFATAPTLAITMAKRQFDSAAGQDLNQALDFEASMQALMVQSEDFKEGSAAFKEKRKPKYVGN